MSDSSSPLRVCSFESRRRDEMASLIRRHGGEATVAPSMQEVPLTENRHVLAFAEKLLKGEVDVVLFLTGVGARAMVEIAGREHSEAVMIEALRSVPVIVRGPKPAAVLREWGVPVTLRAAEPNTWREVLAAIDESGFVLDGKMVAIQEYGESADELRQSIEDRGASVMPVPVYRWALPDDVGPLEAAIRESVSPGFDVVLFTSAQQARHACEIAGRLGLLDDWLSALERSIVGSIGPTCSAALKGLGLPVDLEPSHPKMGTLVRETLAVAPDLLTSRRASQAD